MKNNNWKDQIDKAHKGQTGFFKELENTETMKATQLTPKEIQKMIYALELTYGDESNHDKQAMRLAKKLGQAKAVITAK